jgi:mono/diheme cytochrome c family protein
MMRRGMPTVSTGCLMAALVLAGCERANMVAQDKAQTWDEAAFFPDRSSMRLPVPGTLPRNGPDITAPQPSVITAALLDRGRERFDIFCSPCHGQSGDGKGMIVQRGFPQPPPFTLARLEQSKAAALYDVITNGHGVMYGYADRVPSADRWAIVGYIRALQQSQDAAVVALPPEDSASLGGRP